MNMYEELVALSKRVTAMGIEIERLNGWVQILEKNKKDQAVVNEEIFLRIKTIGEKIKNESAGPASPTTLGAP